MDRFGAHTLTHEINRFGGGEIKQQQQQDEYNFNGKRLQNIGAPTHIDDAVSKKYLDSGKFLKIPLTDTINFKDKILSNVRAPRLPTDVVTKRYMREKALVLSDTFKGYDAFGNIIARVAPPTNDDEVATKLYVDNKCDTQVTKKYMEGNFLKIPDDDAIDFHDKRLTNIKPPRLPTDAVTKRYMREKALVHSETFKGYDASGNIIGRVAQPTNDDEVATKLYVDNIFAKDQIIN